MTSSRPSGSTLSPRRQRRRSQPLPMLWFLVLLLAVATLVLDIYLYLQVQDLRLTNQRMLQTLACLDEQQANPGQHLDCGSPLHPTR